MKTQWSVFASKHPIEIKFLDGAGGAVFKTPMFTARLTEPSNKSFTAVISSVSKESMFG